MKKIIVLAFSVFFAVMFLQAADCGQSKSSKPKEEELQPEFDFKGDIRFTPLDAAKVSKLNTFNKRLNHDHETNPPRIEVEKILKDFFFNIDLKQALLKAGYIRLNEQYIEDDEKSTIKAAIDKIKSMTKEEIDSIAAEDFDQIIFENQTPIENYNRLLLGLIYTNFQFDNLNENIPSDLSDAKINPYVDRIKKLSKMDIVKKGSSYPQEIFTELFNNFL